MYIIAVDGTNEHALTTGGSDCVGQPGHTGLGPDWSKDGSRILFDSARTGSFQLFSMSSDGSDIVQLTSTGDNTTPRYSADGNWIAFSSNRGGGRYEIWVMRADGTAASQVTTPTDPYEFLEGWAAP